MQRIFCIILFTFILLFNLFAQNDLFENTIFEHTSISEGISQSTINTIIQDNIGYIWLGTHDGLNRYDGYDFLVFKGEPQNINCLSNNQVISLCSDVLGNIWVGTLGGGINIYIPERNIFLNYRNSPKLFEGIDDKEIWLIYKDFTNKMIIGTSNGLFYSLVYRDKEGNIHTEFHKIVSSDNNNNQIWIRSITQTPDAFIIGGLNGIYTMNSDFSTFKKIDIKELNRRMILSICRQSKNVFWVGTIEDGLYKITFEDIKSGKINKIERLLDVNHKLHLPLVRIESLHIDELDNLWIASRQGLGRINLKNNKTYVFYNKLGDNTTISDNRTSYIFEDRKGVLWIGTESHGVDRLDLHSKKFVTIRHLPQQTNSLSDNFVYGIHSSGNDKIWIATDGGGIDLLKFDSKNISIIHPEWNKNLINKNIISIYEMKDGTLCFGSSVNALGKIKNSQIQYMPLQGYIFSIYEDNKHNLWVGTWGSGLYIYSSKDNKFYNYRKENDNKKSISSDIVVAIYEEKNHQMWIGTKGGGLNKVTSDVSKIENLEFNSYTNSYDDTSSISHNDVYSILRTRDGDMWVGTGAGLNKLDFNSTSDSNTIRFKSYMEKDGLPNNIIYGILEDNSGNLWLSTNKGLSKFKPKTKQFINFDIHDGIQSNEFHINSYFKDTKGRLFFGGVNGLTFFEPDSIKSNNFIPKVIFTQIKIQGKVINVDEQVNGRVLLKKNISYADRIIITYNDKEFTIEFSTDHYSIPEKNKFRYRLLGFNDNWQEVSYKHRSVTYTNLSQGEYIFQVLASNNDGQWATKPTELIIKVLPPPWLTIWAFIIYAIVIISAIILFKKYTLINVNRKHQLVIDSLEKSKIEELTKMKIQFFTNISHELRTPLTLINNPLEELVNNKKIDSGIKKELSVIQRNVGRLLQLVNQLLDLRKIDAGELKLKIVETNLISLILEIIESFEQYALKRNITINTIYKDQEILLWLDREKIITVFFNLLSNAFKYSPDNSNISIEVVYDSKQKDSGATSYVEIAISDEGIGIEKEYLPHIFDRFYQVEGVHQKGKSGTGIGLAICKEYIEIHGGYIKVDSEVGKGTTFRVFLPVRKDQLSNYIEITENEQILLNETAEASSQLLSTLKATLDNTIEGEGSKKSILIIEDNIDLLHYLSARFSSKYIVYTAENAVKGLKLAYEKNPNLIITDIMLPDEDGIEICRKIKNDIQTSHIPIIILTAKSTIESNIEGLEAGADVYIKKPFNMDVLKAQVKATIESREKLRLNFTKNIILQPKEIVATSLDERFMIKLMDVIEKNISNPDFGIRHLTDAMNMSHSVIFRKIKALTGSNVIEFIRSVRLKKAAQLLTKQKLPVTEVSIMVGFNDPKYFSKCFIKEFGMSPREYMKTTLNNDNLTN